MPLTDFQTGIARRLAQNRTPDSYLAGGAALHIEPNSKRYSNDLDYFHDSVERVASAFQEDRDVLTAAGYSVDVLFQQPGFVRAIVKKRDKATKIEWAHDSAWRFMPPIRRETAGFQLHPVDLAINKVLALIGRDEARDFLDVLDVDEHILGLGALVWAAAGKDPGFTPQGILSLLRRKGRYHPEDFARLHLRHSPDLAELKERWIAALGEAERFIRSRPLSEVGCLYYSRTRSRFVSSWEPKEDVVPHHGRPGGVLPKLDESE